MKKYSLGALVAAGLLVGGLSAGSASAADLGGNCCADLEERIAELEATTARKGNRKVSLTISGWVAQQVMWWDDGFEQNVYVTDIGATLDTHFKLTGQATISPGWTAGYVIHIEAGTSEVRAVDQGFFNNVLSPTTNPVHGDEGGSAVTVLQSFWFIKSDTLGKVSVGKQSAASDNTAILVDGSGSLVPANWVTFTGESFFLRRASGNAVNTVGLGANNFSVRQGDLAFCNTLLAGALGGDCNGGTQDAVRYDSPTFGGFSVSATWGEDDFWDVAARYAGEFGGFKVAVAAAYTQTTDFPPGTLQEVDYFQIGGYIEHVATGVFAYGAWGQEETDLDGGGSLPDGEVWYVKAGLRERWTPLGHTVLYGFYGENTDKLNPVLYFQGYHDSELTVWGAGAVQEIDAAAMSLWIHYQRNEPEVEFGPFGSVPLEDFDSVKAGALINF
jgi:hypothetical protein